MFLVDQVILLAGVLLLIGILSSKLSVRMGLPVLVLFLILGMLAGEQGVGGIVFDNVPLSHAIGTLALAAILFDGGLRTPVKAIRAVWKPSVLLATVGVLVTAVITGVAAAYILDIPLLQGILLGSIVGSTDAAAVFALLRHAGVNLKKRLAATLEIESGSNDPMAIFLTIGLIEVLLGDIALGPQALQLFVLQMGLGAIAGLGVGWLAVRAINRVNLEAAGLYPVLAGVFGLLAFGSASVLGGSGFLAIYLAGIVIGNSRIVFHQGTFFFHDGLAWIGQIVMFVVLGLLSMPSDLLEIAVPALAVAAVLILVARPLAVVPLLLPFRFSFREIVLISWVGLKGAVPIILALYPLMYGFPDADLLFNVVFFVVLVSAVTQGWTLPVVARKLGLEMPAQPVPPVALEIVSLRDVDADIVEYTLSAESRAAGRRLDQLALPEGAVIAMIARHQSLIPPRRSTQLLLQDHVFVVLRPEIRPLVDRIFTRDPIERVEPLASVEFQLAGNWTVEALESSYGIVTGLPRNLTIDKAVRTRLGDELRPGAVVRAEQATLQVVEIIDGRITTVNVIVENLLALDEGQSGGEGDTLSS